LFIHKKPYILRLYKWNKTRTSAYCSKEQFNKVFSGYNVIYDVDNDVIYAPFHVGENSIIVIRDKDE